MGSRPPSAPRPSTERNQASPRSGGSSWRTSVVLATPLTWLRPLVEPLRHLGAGGDRRRERRAVEAGDEGLADVGGVADHRRRGRALELLARLQRDRVHDGADHLERDRARVLAREHRDRAGHGAGEPADVAVVDPGRRPAHVQVHDLALGVPLGPQAGHDAALGHQPDRRDGDPPEPADARADAVLVALTAADGDDQPAERLFDGDRQRGGAQAVREGDVGVDGPAEARAAERLEAVGEVGVRVGDHVGAAGPDDDRAVLPRRLQPDLAGGVRGGDEHLGPGAGGADEQVVGGFEAVEVGLDVGHHLGALGTLDAADGLEVVLGLVHQPLEDQAPCDGIGFEHRPLLSGSDALSCCPRRGFESTCEFWHAEVGAVGAGGPLDRIRRGASDHSIWGWASATALSCSTSRRSSGDSGLVSGT